MKILNVIYIFFQYYTIHNYHKAYAYGCLKRPFDFFIRPLPGFPILCTISFLDLTLCVRFLFVYLFQGTLFPIHQINIILGGFIYELTEFVSQLILILDEEVKIIQL